MTVDPADTAFWGATPEESPTVTPPVDVTALLVSLGEPPLTGGTAALATVYAEASRMATLLARAGGVLADDTAD